MACSNRRYLLRELDAGYTLVITEGGCKTVHPTDPNIGTEYKFGQMALLGILLDRMEYKWKI